MAMMNQATRIQSTIKKPASKVSVPRLSAAEIYQRRRDQVERAKSAATSRGGPYDFG